MMNENNLEQITNDAQVDRRGFFNTIYDGIKTAGKYSAVAVIVSACGSGGGSSSSDSGNTGNDGNGNGGTTPEPVIDHAYIKGQLEAAGYTVHDAQTNNLNADIPQHVWHYGIQADVFMNAYNNDSAFNAIFSSADSAIQYLNDGISENDEMRQITATKDNLVMIVANSNDPNIGENGLYAAIKSISAAELDSIKCGSHYSSSQPASRS